LVSSLDIPIRKSWGQNFIIDKNTINKIVKIINPQIDEEIIEIGPGRGAITMPLLDKVQSIVAIEIDPLLTQYLKDKNKSNLIVENIDFMDWSPSFKNKRRVIGNLPYYISSPIIFKLIKDERFNEIIIMLQKELGIRMLANEGNKDYSRMSVMAQTFCEIKYETDISKNIFNPKPNVDSCIISLKRKKSDLDFEKYSKYIRYAFQHKRKKIKNNLKNYISQEGLEKFGERRAQDISVEEYIETFNKYFF
tara:strand:+ start:98 stop:847 length:750 start_codon:yes stop_codon:yes gene_type:complete